MARTDNLSNFLSDVADAIKEKNNITGAIKAADFDNQIKNISTGINIKGIQRNYYVYQNNTIESGDFVSFKNGVASEGPFKRLVSYEQAISTSAGFNSSTPERSFAIDENRILCYTSDRQLTLLKYNGASSFTKAATASFSSSYFPDYSFSYSNGIRWDNDENGNARVVFFGVYANDPDLTAVVVTIGQDDTINIGSYNRISCSKYCREVNAARTADNRILCNYYDYNGSGYVYRFLTINGNSVSWSDATTSPLSLSGSWHETFLTKNGTILVRSSTVLYPITVNGNTITTGTKITLPVQFNAIAQYNTSNNNEINLIGIYLNGTSAHTKYKLSYYIMNLDSNLTLTVVENSIIDESWYSGGNRNFTIVPMDIDKVVFTTCKWDSSYNLTEDNDFSVYICHLKNEETVCFEKIESFYQYYKFLTIPVCICTSPTKLYVGSPYRNSISYYHAEAFLQIPNYETQTLLATTEVVNGIAKTSGIGGDEYGHKDIIQVYVPKN
jgi:hypothetical protein